MAKRVTSGFKVTPKAGKLCDKCDGTFGHEPFCPEVGGDGDKAKHEQAMADIVAKMRRDQQEIAKGIRAGTLKRFSGVKVKPDGSGFECKTTDLGDPKGTAMSARFDLFLIRQAWDRGCDMEALADGFGTGAGTHGDWSGIRDSSDAAIERMLERVMNFLFPAR